MAKLLRKLDVQAIPLALSQIATRELPKTVFQELILELDLVHTNSDTVALTWEQVAKAVPKINILADGQDNVVSCSLQHLYGLSYYDRAIAPPVTLGTASGAGKLSALTLPIPFALGRASAPDDTLYDARKLSSLVLEAQFGAAAIMTNVAVTSGNLSISTTEYDNVDPKATFGRHELAYMIQPVSVAGINQIKIPVGSNNQYRRIFVFYKDANGDLADSVLTGFDLYARSYHWQNQDAVNIKRRNQFEYGVTPLTGVYVLDLTSYGKMSERLDARALPELNLDIVSASAAGTVEIFMEKAIYA